MSSLSPGFEYDIFISYRQNDNRNGWVTAFVKVLQEELAAAIKEPVSIYFDENPHDGLLETHHVAKSLEGKLKSFIFIPILSQTYCDPKSFAWQHEFCAFNKFVGEGGLGREIRLVNGNFASRILPVRIHDIDASDLSIIENEIGGPLRSIDFIYKEPGVNRPLMPADLRADNIHKVDYRNQVNKVANAIKDLIATQRAERGDLVSRERPTAANSAPGQRKKSIIAAGAIVIAALAVASMYFFNGNEESEMPANKKRVAVLPFKLVGDKEGDYFASGMRDVLVQHLRANENLSLPPSLASTDRFAETTLPHLEIARELEADFLIEASAQKWGDSIRLFVELIDPANDKTIWSDNYKAAYARVFEVQESIATSISNALGAALSGGAVNKIRKRPTDNLEAYDLYLQIAQLVDKYARNRDTTHLQEAREMAKRAIRLDPQFAEPYIILAGSMWFPAAQLSPMATWRSDSVERLLNMGLERNPEYGFGLSLKSQFVFFQKHDTVQALAIAQKAIENGVYERDLLMWLGWLYHYWFMDGREALGLQYYSQAYRDFPDKEARVHTSWNIGLFFMHMGDFARAETFIMESLRLEPNQLRVAEDLARLYLQAGQFGKIGDVITLLEKIHNDEAPNDYSYLRWGITRDLYTGNYTGAMKACETYLASGSVDDIFTSYVLLLEKTGNRSKAHQLLQANVEELLKDPIPNQFMLGRCYAMLGDREASLSTFEKDAFNYRSNLKNPFFLSRDLMLESIRKEPRYINKIKTEIDRRKSILERVNMMEKEHLIEVPELLMR